METQDFKTYELKDYGHSETIKVSGVGKIEIHYKLVLTGEGDGDYLVKISPSMWTKILKLLEETR